LPKFIRIEDPQYLRKGLIGVKRDLKDLKTEEIISIDPQIQREEKSALTAEAEDPTKERSLRKRNKTSIVVTRTEGLLTMIITKENQLVAEIV
jgi:hypothetical protein